jgi:hypothetical protein
MLTTGGMRDQTWYCIFSWESQTYPTPSARFQPLLPIAIEQAHGTGHHDLFGKGNRELTDRGKRMRQWPVQQLRQPLLLRLLQAAIAALLREGIRPRGQWGHAFVQAQLVGVLINQRKRYEPQLRWGRADNQTRRGQADSHAELVTATQAGRALCRSRLCVTAVRQRGGVAQ